jgi:hypothetical protein
LEFDYVTVIALNSIDLQFLSDNYHIGVETYNRYGESIWDILDQRIIKTFGD